MKRWINYGVAAAAMLGVMVLLFVSTPAAQNTAPAAKAAVKTPRTADGHPDFSGFYNRDIFHGDPNQELAGQHFINRASDGNIFLRLRGSQRSPAAPGF
jgi:hypothetical protein